MLDYGLSSLLPLYSGGGRRNLLPPMRVHAIPGVQEDPNMLEPETIFARPSQHPAATTTPTIDPMSAVDAILKRFGGGQKTTTLPPTYPPRMLNPEEADAIGRPRGLMMTDPDLEAALRPRQVDTAVDPNLPNILSLRARATAADDMARRLGGQPVPQMQPGSLGEMPMRGEETVPERQPVQPNRMARIAAVLGSFLAPESGGSFLASELGGEQQGQEQKYQDALTGYQLKTRRDDTRYQDATTRYGLELENRQRNADIAYRNQLAQQNQAEALMRLQGQGEEERGVAGALEHAGELARPSEQIGALLTNVGEREKRAEAQAKRQEDLEKAGLTGENSLLRALTSGMFAQGRADTMAGALSGRANDANALKAAGQGLQFTPSTGPGGRPIITPAPEGSMPLPLLAKRNKDIALADAAAARAAAIKKGPLPRAAKSTDQQLPQVRVLNTVANQARQEATAAQKAFDTFDKVNPWAKRKEHKSDPKAKALYDQGMALWNKAQEARKRLQDVEGRRDTLLNNVLTPAGGKTPDVPHIKTTAEARKLAPGTHFIGPDGHEYIR